MAKDYFEDITPPEETKRVAPPVAPSTAPATSADEKSIRNITVNRSRSAPPPPRDIPPQKRENSRWILWTIAFVAIIILAALAAVALRKTTVTIIPHTQTVTFDETAQISAYPSSTSSTGMLMYSVQTQDFDDSEVLAATGRKLPDHQASGSVTVVNEYSKDPVKLIKNTRFQSPDGSIYKSPFDVLVPGMKNGTAGTMQVSVISEKPGSQYNIGPTSRFSLPGLVGNKDMYSKVYARSSVAMTGGSSASDPGVDPSALASAQTAMRTRLEEKARASVKAIDRPTIALPELVTILYQDQPSTSEANNSIRVHLKAHLSIPTFSENDFATAVLRWANTDPQGATLTYIPLNGFSVSPVNASSTTLGVSPIVFSLKGAAQVIWHVDTAAVGSALAGKDRDAFHTIVSGFSSIQEAKTQIEPFWARHFPNSPSAIYIIVTDSAKSSQ